MKTMQEAIPLKSTKKKKEKKRNRLFVKMTAVYGMEMVKGLPVEKQKRLRIIMTDLDAVRGSSLLL